MKRVYLVLLSFLFSSHLLFAQSGADFGVKAGVNIASLKWSSDMDQRIGLHGGLIAHIHLSPQIALQPEVLYSAEGAKQVLPSGMEATWKNDYVNIPVMIQYMFDNGFRIEAGPQLGLLVSSNLKGSDNSESETGDVFKSTNVSLGFGVNYLSYSGFGIGGRYNLGLSEINEPAWPVAKGRTAQISLFYMFNSAHKAKSR